MKRRFLDFKLFEFEEKINLPSAEKISFMDKLHQMIKDEIVPIIPKEFKIDYNRGKEIKIHTGNRKDLSVGVKVKDDKMIIYANPIDEPAFEFNYNFNIANLNSITDVIKGEFERSDSLGLNITSKRSTTEPITRDLKSFRDEDKESDEDIQTPIKRKQRKVKRTIDINIIKEVLEDAYILDDIDLKNISVNELVRRMLVESRKK